MEIGSRVRFKYRVNNDRRQAEGTLVYLGKSFRAAVSMFKRHGSGRQRPTESPVQGWVNEEIRDAFMAASSLDIRFRFCTGIVILLDRDGDHDPWWLSPKKDKVVALNE